MTGKKVKPQFSFFLFVIGIRCQKHKQQKKCSYTFPNLTKTKDQRFATNFWSMDLQL